MPRLLWLRLQVVQESLSFKSHQVVDFIPFSDVFTIQLQTALLIDQFLYNERATQRREERR